MKTSAFILPLALFLACRTDPSTHDHSPGHTAERTDTQHEHQGHKHDGANAHMHNSSIEELIERFDSPERDEYQRPGKVLDHLGDLEGKTIIDIGAGSGYFSFKLAERGARVIAADVEQGFLDHIRKQIEENGLQNIELRKIPYDSPGSMEKEADMVLLVNTYHHIEDRVGYFTKVRAGTKDDGELVIIDFFKTDAPVGPPVDHKISMDVVVDELKKAGYSNFSVNVDLLPYQYIVRAQ